MNEASIMSEPITRGEVKEELAQLRSEFEPWVTRTEIQCGMETLRAEMALLAANGGMERIRAEIAHMTATGELQKGVETIRAEIAELVKKPEFLAKLEHLRSEIRHAASSGPLAAQGTLPPLATKGELDLCVGAMVNYMGRMNRELRTELRTEMQRMGQELREELRRELNEDVAQHVRASDERMHAFLRGFEDKYRDLPPRVSALESAVFPGEPR